MRRPFVHPLVRSIAAPGGRLVPARSHGVERSTEFLDGQGDAVLWSPFFTVGVDELGPRMTSGPQAGEPTRPPQGTAYVTPASLWNLAGVQTGWSMAGGASPSKQPTTKLALGRGWLPFGNNGANSAPLPGLPEPARMVPPRLPA